MTVTVIQPLLRFPLAMQPGNGPLRDTAAWFVPGAETASWLTEMTAWNMPLIDARLYPIPTDINDPNPCGLLVVLQSGSPMLHIDARSRVHTALPYAQIANRLYFPADATLNPEVSADEVKTLLLWDVQVLHPSAGLVGYHRDDARGVESLLLPPVRTASDWSFAETGVSTQPSLISVQSERLPSMEQILEMGRDDIGLQADEQPPAGSDESPVGDTVNSALRPLMKMMLMLIVGKPKLPPPGSQSPDQRPRSGQPTNPLRVNAKARQPGWLRQWAMRKLREINNASQELRNRELDRLMKLLAEDPDVGLQFALPMRDIMTRGSAPPANVLGRRDVNFNLSKLLGGGSAGDRWAVPEDVRQQLQRQYRESANRELNLGRFSRAAYIFAHLLGDYAAAADALKRGRSYRDAAVIYKEQLKNPRAAADCFKDGGFLLDAIPLYKSLQQFETAGDLHAKMGQYEEAQACYREAVSLMVEKNNIVSAAALLETKLHSADEALELLAKAWPDHDASDVCLREWFALCGRLARHDVALDRVKLLGSTALPDDRRIRLVQNLSRISATYPDIDVQHQSADLTRVLAGLLLASAIGSERAELIKAVVSLVPGDRLLMRDGNRFLNKVISKPGKLPIPVKEFTPTIKRSFKLPGGNGWQAIAAMPGGFLAMGSNAAERIFARATWKGQLDQVTTTPQSHRRQSCVLLPPTQGGDAVVVVFTTSGDIVVAESVEKTSLPPMNLFNKEVVIESPAYITQNCRALCRDETGTVWVLSDRDEYGICISAHDASGRLLSSHSIDTSLWPVKTIAAAAPVAMRRGTIYIPTHQFLIRYNVANKKSVVVELPAVILGLIPSPTHTATRLIATFADGCALINDQGEYRNLAAGLVDPMAAFTPDGSIVLIGKKSGQVYGRVGTEMRFLTSFDVNQVPIAVLPADYGEVAVFDYTGNVDVYQVVK